MLSYLCWALLVLSIVSLVKSGFKIYQQRCRMRGLPGPPHHPIFGHLLVAFKMGRALPPDVFPHHYWNWLREQYNLGDVFYFDVYPLAPPTLVICSAEAAEQVTVKNSLDKHPMVKAYTQQHIGSENLAATNGAVWKKARTTYNPGFAVAHLTNFASGMVEDIIKFRGVLSGHANTGKTFSFEEIVMKLTFDVVGKLVLDVSLDSQRTSHVLVDAFRKQLQLLSSSCEWFSPFMKLNLVRRFAVWRNGRFIDQYLGRTLDQRLSSTDVESIRTKAQPRCIIDFALERFVTETQHLKSKGDTRLDGWARKSVIDHLKIFLFAGHDAISTTITMIFYYLSKNEVIKAKACAEIDAILGPTSDSAAQMIRGDPYILNKLVYCTAIIKEVLRIYPPANTVRIGRPDVTITDSTGESYPTHDWIVWPDAYVIGRNEEYFPEPKSFIPERFLADSPFDPIPVGAWRPFERGPRNCIGGEFGLLEMKAVMALTLRDFDFEPAYPEGAPEVNGEQCYQMLFGSAKPKDNMPGRMRRRSRRTPGTSVFGVSE